MVNTRRTKFGSDSCGTCIVVERDPNKCILPDNTSNIYYSSLLKEDTKIIFKQTHHEKCIDDDRNGAGGDDDVGEGGIASNIIDGLGNDGIHIFEGEKWQECCERVDEEDLEKTLQVTSLNTYDDENVDEVVVHSPSTQIIKGTREASSEIDGNDVICAECEQDVINKINGLECSRCNNWYHKSCIKLVKVNGNIGEKVKTCDQWVCCNCYDNVRCIKYKSNTKSQLLNSCDDDRTAQDGENLRTLDNLGIYVKHDHCQDHQHSVYSSRDTSDQATHQINATSLRSQFSVNNSLPSASGGNIYLGGNISPTTSSEDGISEDIHINNGNILDEFGDEAALESDDTETTTINVCESQREAAENNTIISNPAVKGCSKCRNVFTQRQRSICCDNCYLWFHISCVSVSRSTWERIVKTKEEWCCSPCKSRTRQYIQLKEESGDEEVLSGATWGILKGRELKNAVDGAYNEVVKWQKNIFKLPSGKAGKEFLNILTELFNSFNVSSPLEPIAMKVIMIVGPILLQKPSQNSKTKDHVLFLEKRIKLWRNGQLSELMRECQTIQKRLIKNKPNKEHCERVFVRLMLRGRVSAALKWISKSRSTMMEITPEVIEQLKSKHPPAAEIKEDTLLYGPKLEVEEVIYQSIDSDAVYKAAKNTHGSAGPSGIDAESWQRFLCSKSFKTSSRDLCEAIAGTVRKIATAHIIPEHLSAFTASRLIPLDKKPGIRPIGVGETLRRICGRTITTLLKPEIVECTAPLQACGGLKGGVEAAVHGIRRIFEDTETDAILLVDAENAFNALNRKAALHNTSIICPELSVYLQNTYQEPADLYIANSGGESIKSEEGTTQGDNLAMSYYACGAMKLIKSLKGISLAKSVWYADDSACGGKLEDIRKWWDALKETGPNIGYFPKSSKTWLVVKADKEKEARELFTDVNITTEGHRYLGSFIGTEAGKEIFMGRCVSDWVDDINSLSKVAKTEPQLAYAAYVYGTSKKWNYVMRTTPNISRFLTSIEEALMLNFIPSITGQQINDLDRKVYTLPVRHGGMAIDDPNQISDREYNNSLKMTEQIWTAMVEQRGHLVIDKEKLLDTKKEICKEKKEKTKTLKQSLLDNMTSKQARQIALISEKGASAWLSALPIEQYGFVLNKQEFYDAVALRYNFHIPNRSKTCSCGANNTEDHCLICKRGGFVSMRHNTIRDTTASLLAKVCKDVITEPKLLPLTGEELPSGSNTSNEARLDVSARGLWSPLDKAFLDIRVLHPNAASNENKSLAQMYYQHEQEKKRLYNQRVIQVEHATFTPIVMSTTGGMSSECNIFFKRLSYLLSIKTGQAYSDTIGYVRKRMRFELLRTCLIAIRGHRGRFYQRPLDVEEMDLNLIRDVTQ